jgi:hypothetical protein
VARGEEPCVRGEGRGARGEGLGGEDYSVEVPHRGFTVIGS